MKRQLCIVLMPFGKKPDVGGSITNFDAGLEVRHLESSDVSEKISGRTARSLRLVRVAREKRHIDR